MSSATAPASKKVAFVLVPPAFSSAAVYDKLSAKLGDLGYLVKALTLPSVGKPETAEGTDGQQQGPSFYDDAAHIRSAVNDLADQEHDVVLVGNSYGGIVATEAVEGTLTAARAAAGKPGGLIHLVLIASRLTDVGSSVMDAQSAPEQPYMEVPDFEHSAALSCSDLDEAEQRRRYALLRPQSVRAFSEKLTHAGYLHVPTTAVVTLNDKALKPELQEELVDRAIASGVMTVRKVCIQADHCAMISHPDEVADILLDAAGEKVN